MTAGAQGLPEDSSGVPNITESTAILSSACENQLFHPPRMPVSQGRVNGRVVNLLGDTGCSGVVIKQSLVRPDQLNGKTQMCVLIDGTKISSPVATIEIDTPYFKGEVEAWCMQNPVYDLIVGNKEGARLPGEPDPNWQLVRAVTRAQKKEEAESSRTPSNRMHTRRDEKSPAGR